MWNKLYKYILENYYKHFFLRVLFLFSIIDVTFLIIEGQVLYSFYLCSVNYLIACFFDVGHGFICKYRVVSLLYRCVVCVVAFIMCCIDAFCVVDMHSRFDIGFAGIIVGTNLSEASEFVQTFVNWQYFWILCTILIVFYLIGKIKIVHNKKFFLWRISLVFLMAVCVSLKMPSVWTESFIGKISLLYKAADCPKLLDYAKPCKLSLKEDKRPSIIVVILGESFSKSHSSLYGYKRSTNPMLEVLRDSSNLFVFNNVEAPSTYTTEAFKCFMSTYSSEGAENSKWFSQPTIIGVAKQCGYYTSWVSNQCMTGIMENPIAEYATLCDESFFVGKQFAGMGEPSYDEKILSVLKKRNNCLQFIHLMGSHEKFDERYPSDRVRFIPNDYVDVPASQRQILANYDNSILYNDSVVNEIIKMYENDECVIFYFSDHALDLYESSSSYFGHSVLGDSESVKYGKRIPFMIYLSDTFKSRFPIKSASLIKNIETHYKTENMIYTLMDIMGVSFSDNNDVNKYTLMQ